MFGIFAESWLCLTRLRGMRSRRPEILGEFLSYKYSSTNQYSGTRRYVQNIQTITYFLHSKEEYPMPMMKEFRDFAMRGNVVDMAVGIIIGAAFGRIVSSLVADVIMPPIGLLLGGIDFSGLAMTLKEGPPAVLLKYGVFINTIIDFVIVAFAIFLLIKGVNSMKKAQQAPAPSTKDCPECGMSIPISAKRCGHCTVVFQGR